MKLQCITLYVPNDPAMNQDASLSKYLGAYFHYPVEHITGLDLEDIQKDEEIMVNMGYSLKKKIINVTCLVYDPKIILVKPGKFIKVHSDGASNAVSSNSKSKETDEQNDIIESTQQPLTTVSGQQAQPDIVEVIFDDQPQNLAGTKGTPFLRIPLKEKPRNNSAVLTKNLPSKENDSSDEEEEENINDISNSISNISFNEKLLSEISENVETVKNSFEEFKSHSVININQSSSKFTEIIDNLKHISKNQTSIISLLEEIKVKKRDFESAFCGSLSDNAACSDFPASVFESAGVIEHYFEEQTVDINLSLPDNLNPTLSSSYSIETTQETGFRQVQITSTPASTSNSGKKPLIPTTNVAIRKNTIIKPSDGRESIENEDDFIEEFDFLIETNIPPKLHNSSYDEIKKNVLCRPIIEAIDDLLERLVDDAEKFKKFKSTCLGRRRSRIGRINKKLKAANITPSVTKISSSETIKNSSETYTNDKESQN